MVYHTTRDFLSAKNNESYKNCRTRKETTHFAITMYNYHDDNVNSI